MKNMDMMIMIHKLFMKIMVNMLLVDEHEKKNKKKITCFKSNFCVQIFTKKKQEKLSFLCTRKVSNKQLIFKFLN